MFLTFIMQRSIGDVFPYSYLSIVFPYLYLPIHKICTSSFSFTKLTRISANERFSSYEHCLFLHVFHLLHLFDLRLQFIIRVTKLYYISISYYVRHLLIQYILNVALIFCFDTFLILFEQITITFRKLTFSFLENVRFD